MSLWLSSKYHKNCVLKVQRKLCKQKSNRLRDRQALIASENCFELICIIKGGSSLGLSGSYMHASITPYATRGVGYNSKRNMRKCLSNSRENVHNKEYNDKHNVDKCSNTKRKHVTVSMQDVLWLLSKIAISSMLDNSNNKCLCGGEHLKPNSTEAYF